MANNLGRSAFDSNLTAMRAEIGDVRGHDWPSQTDSQICKRRCCGSRFSSQTRPAVGALEVLRHSSASRHGLRMRGRLGMPRLELGRREVQGR
jgi:hypothetical protein